MDNSLLSMIRRMLLYEYSNSEMSHTEFAKRVRIGRTSLQKILYSDVKTTRRGLYSSVVDTILSSLGYTYSDLEQMYRIDDDK